MQLILMSGKMQTGKDSSYKIIKGLLPYLRVGRIGLADSVKECACALGVPYECLYGNKNQTIGKWGEYFNEKICAEFNQSAKGSITGRQFLQALGTNLFRNKCNKNIWINTCKRHIKRFHKNADIICVTDCRFKNELFGFEEFDNIKVRLYRATGISDSHASECELDSVPDSEFDHVILAEQNINLEMLKESWQNILRKESYNV